MLTLVIIGIISTFRLQGSEDEDYSYARIPTLLLKDANAVIRESETEIKIVSNTEIYETRRYAITILNEEGRKYDVLREYYNKGLNVISIKGWLYDKEGKELVKIKNNAIKDIGISGESFFDDYRYKFFEFNYVTYPYTCVFEVQTVSNSSTFLPSWRPKFNYDCAIEKAELVVSYPKNIAFRYRSFHVKDVPRIITDQDERKLAMNIYNLPAGTKPDNFTPVENYQDPALIMALDNMSLLGFEGSMASWKELGSFIYNLNANRDELPDETRKYVHQLTDTCKSTKEKIDLLYAYLQQNTRYVNIDLGIGGWQTMDAKSVAQTGYGDCKALSNFMKALLKEAGITAYQVLVYGGEIAERTMELDFPYSMFNHVILCVPGSADTTWLECTDKHMPAGYLSSFTGNRNVLLLTSLGGYVVKTPAYNAEVSTMVRSARIVLDAKDEITGSVTASYMGLWWNREINYVNQSKSQVDNYFNSKFTIPAYTVGNYTINKEVRNGIPIINESIPLTGNGIISRMGDRVFLSPHVFNLSVESAASIENRKDSFQIFNDYQVFDTTEIVLDGAYIAEKLAGDLNYDFPFASYHTKTFFENDNKLKIVVYYRQKEGVYAPDLFVDYKKISKLINTNAAYSKIILMRKK